MQLLALFGGIKNTIIGLVTFALSLFVTKTVYDKNKAEENLEDLKDDIQDANEEVIENVAKIEKENLKKEYETKIKILERNSSKSNKERVEMIKKQIEDLDQDEHITLTL